MSNLTITTNNHWHNFLYFTDLTPKQKDKFLDYMTEDKANGLYYISYKGKIYCIDSFTRMAGDDDCFGNWHGCNPQGFYYGLLIRLNEDGNMYQIANYKS